MTTDAASPPSDQIFQRRQPDRRAGLYSLVRTLAAEAAAEPRGLPLRSLLERQLAAMLGVSRARVVEGAPPLPSLDRVPVRDPSQLILAVPGPLDDGRARLEVELDTRRALDAWEEQLLESGAHLAALVLALDRRGHRPRRVADGAAPLIGSSRVMTALRDRIARVAATDFTVLIEGESGTGKELVARQIHALSPRRHGPFVAVNCAAIVETLLEAELFGIEDRTATGVRGRRGKFEYADGGTLFLDEVSDLSVAAQAKLLRALQDLTVERVGGHGERRVHLRVVAATNRPLAGLVAQGSFRADLYYRLSGIDVAVPPLRSRKGDIPELARYFLSRHAPAGRAGLSHSALDALVAYDWPGNVRELERLLEGALAMATGFQVGLDDLPASLRGPYAEILAPSARAGDTMREWGSRYARLVLERCGHNKREACRVLGISYHTLQAYLRFQPRAPRHEPPAVTYPASRSTAHLTASAGAPLALCREPEDAP